MRQQTLSLVDVGHVVVTSRMHLRGNEGEKSVRGRRGLTRAIVRRGHPSYLHGGGGVAG